MVERAIVLDTGPIGVIKIDIFYFSKGHET